MTYRLSTAKNLYTYVSSLIVQAFLLGIVGILLSSMVYVVNLQQFYQENILFSIELKPNASAAEVFAYQKELEVSTFVEPKTVEYISKEDGIKLLEGKVGREELLLFGKNPLPNMLRFQVNSVALADLDKILREIESLSFVQELVYTEDMINKSRIPVLWWSTLATFLVIILVSVQWVPITSYLRLNMLESGQMPPIVQCPETNQKQFNFSFRKQCMLAGGGTGLVALVFWWLLLWGIEESMPSLPNFKTSFLSFCIGSVIMGTSLISWWNVSKIQMK